MAAGSDNLTSLGTAEPDAMVVRLVCYFFLGVSSGEPGMVHSAMPMA